MHFLVFALDKHEGWFTKLDMYPMPWRGSQARILVKSFIEIGMSWLN